MFKQFEIIKLEDMKKLEVCKFVSTDINIHKNSDFNSRLTIYSYSTRNHASIILPQPRTNVLLHSIFYDGVRCFNELPSELKDIRQPDAFKYKLKLLLLSRYTEG